MAVIKDLAHMRANPLPTDTEYFDIAHYIRHSPTVFDYDLRAKFEQWRETGVVMFEQAVPPAHIEAFLADVEHLCVHRDRFDLEVEHLGARYRLRDVHQFTDYLAARIRDLSMRREIFLPRRGDVLIWHGNLLHEGTMLRDARRTRRSFVTHYTSRSSYAHDHFFSPVQAPRKGAPVLPSWRQE